MDAPLVLKAPAKINLHLSIGALRADGYHDVDTVMQTLELADMMTLTFGHEGGFELACEPPVDVPAEQNLVWKAAHRLAEALGLEPDSALSGIHVLVKKHIPAQGGLGGGSSDAATTIRALCLHWGVNPLSEEALSVARSLGADVAFFLYGGCVLLSGRGDEYVCSLPTASAPVVLVKPEGGVSTGEAYRSFDAAPSAESLPAPEAYVTVADAHDLAPLLFNNLAPAVYTLRPDIAELAAWLQAAPGTCGTLLSGSGATVFALCESDEAAARIANEAAARGFWALATRLG